MSSKFRQGKTTEINLNLSTSAKNDLYRGQTFGRSVRDPGIPTRVIRSSRLVKERQYKLRNLVRRHFRPVLTRANLAQSLRLYDLRHSCATLLLSAGENPKVGSERLGHASIVLTLDTYSHVLPSMQQAATEKLERILYG